ncbi:AIR synthase-related protein [Escherichia coli]|nr:AIR synthase-related protein [Escherichia coli]MCV7919372.1 AIR synthase-related protein [Escherichia coli]MCV8024341.1 AIR synthase-related protein [Escherichia coli]MEC4152365.1 AIR synthase-related protein [Escherichia coli]WJS57810.1 AIR synthase-related protein [Escherichia coli]
MLGVDVINLANEGCLCLFVEPEYAQKVLHLLQEHPVGKHATIIGEITAVSGTEVYMIEADGTHTEVEELYGAELPRLC